MKTADTKADTKRFFPIASAILAASLLLAAALLLAWIKGVYLPSWIDWESRTCPVSFDGEALRVSLQNRCLIVTDADGNVDWEPGRAYQVQDFLVADINHDGVEELMLLAWKIGRYGSARPFWIDHDELAWFQHIYIYRWSGESFSMIWGASDLGMEVASWSFDSTMRLEITETSGRITHWDWLSWGLTMLDE